MTEENPRSAYDEYDEDAYSFLYGMGGAVCGSIIGGFCGFALSGTMVGLLGGMIARTYTSERFSIFRLALTGLGGALVVLGTLGAYKQAWKNAIESVTLDLKKTAPFQTQTYENGARITLNNGNQYDVLREGDAFKLIRTEQESQIEVLRQNHATNLETKTKELTDKHAREQAEIEVYFSRDQ